MVKFCRVRDADNLNTTIQFVRNSDQSTVCSCEQRGDHCSCDNTGYTDYLCYCRGGTKKTNSETKLYALVKRKADDEDVGDWLCAPGK